MSFQPTTINTVKTILLLTLLSFMTGCPKPVNEINNFATASESVFDTSSKALNEFKNLSAKYNLYMTVDNELDATQSMFTDPYKMITANPLNPNDNESVEGSKRLAADIEKRLKAFSAIKKYAAGIKSLVEADNTESYSKAARSVNDSVKDMQNLISKDSNASFSAAIGTTVYAAGTIITEKIRFKALKSAVDTAEGPVKEISAQIQLDTNDFSSLAVDMLNDICEAHIRHYNAMKPKLDMAQKIALLQRIKPVCQASPKTKEFANDVDKAAKLFASAHAKIQKELNNTKPDFTNARATIEELVATGQSIKETYDDLLKDKK